MQLSDSFDARRAGTAPFAGLVAPSSVPLRRLRDEVTSVDPSRHPRIRPRIATARNRVDVLPTGCAELDAELDGGWPRGALSELLVEREGIGEFGLVAPALAALTQARQRVVLIAPPSIPYAPALAASGIDAAHLVHIAAQAADAHWTAEQCLRTGGCGAVLNWLPEADYRQLRRLQAAAESSAALAFVFRPATAAVPASPAAVRLRLSAGAGSTNIEILKCRGRFGEVSRLRA